MNKMAVFVEGYTEQLFVEKLVVEIAGRKNVHVELRKIRGGKTTRRRMFSVKPVGAVAGQEYYVLIVDCGGDEAVKSRIREEYDNLTLAGHQLLIGVRDVRPSIDRAGIPELRRRLALGMRTKPLRVIFVLSVMEIEAWFLSEYTHFSRLSVPISPAHILSWLGFDPMTEDMETREQPALDMAAIYYLAGDDYDKDPHRLQRTIDLLDFAQVYLALPASQRSEDPC